MDKVRKRVLIALLVGSMILGLAGCTRGNAEEENNRIETVKEMDDVEEGGFYILHSDYYEKLYVQNANYEVENNSGASTDRTLWFNKDWAKIPTMSSRRWSRRRNRGSITSSWCPWPASWT